MKHLLRKLYFGFFLVLLLAVPAFAYLDPGTVTYVVSMVAGLFIAGGAALAIFRRKIKLFFQNLGKKKEQDAPAAAQSFGDEIDPMADVVNPMEEDR